MLLSGYQDISLIRKGNKIMTFKRKAISLSLISILCLSQGVNVYADTSYAFQDKLTQVRDQAKTTGLNVTEGQKVIYKTVAEAEADIKKQEEAVKNAIAWQDAANDNIAKAVGGVDKNLTQVTQAETITIDSNDEAKKIADQAIENVTKVDSQNKEKKSKYDTESEKVENENKKIKEKYDQAQAKYSEDMATYDKNMLIYQDLTKKYEEDLEAYKVAKDIYEKDLNEYKSKLGTEGYPKQLLFQSLNLNKGEPQAKHGVVRGPNPDEIIWKGDKRLGGYSSILDSNGFFLYKNFTRGTTITFNYANLKNATFDGDRITGIQYDITAVSTPSDGSGVWLVVPNDPTEGFIAYRNEGNGNWRTDRIEFRVTARYYTAKGQVRFTEKTPGVFTHYSLNHNVIGLEYVKDSSGDLVEITGSSIKKCNDPANSAWATGGGNNSSDLGLPEEWDTSSSRYAYKGAILASITSGGDSYTVTYGQGDMGGARASHMGSYTYWFGINTLPVSPLAKEPPKEPTKPTEPTPPVAPAVPHYDPKPQTPQYEGVTIPKVVSKVSLHEVEVQKTPVTIKIKKYKEDGTTPLEGVTYEVKWVKNSDEEQLSVAQYTPAVTEVGQSVKLTTDKNGEVDFTNLPQGEYQITETKTPAGYTLLKDSIKTTLPLTYTKEEAQKQNIDTSKAEWNEKEQKYYVYSATYEVTNDKGFTIPKTGGEGIWKIGFLGMILMFAVGSYVVSMKYKRA
ncbi:hypothetical protein GPZ88_09945 (plasmid) [Streptococcus ruminicola]|uniref:LPXTG cell wall anchor domain-containing protein n=2 Tax=Streptococcus TaxID=1301 RepID=A0A6G8I2Q5_9STRE|nr:hypothetical protein GPA00_09400 [Streptococcus equinus]QIM47390.1 hypothetical protein GPZ88_09945 [Streptococcus ruminicola]